MVAQLVLEEYSSLISLDRKDKDEKNQLFNKQELVNHLLDIFIKENNSLKNVEIPSDYHNKRELLKDILTIRKPNPLPKVVLTELNQLLLMEAKEKGIVDIQSLSTGSEIMHTKKYSNSDKFILWKGDITRLNADVIVNAANKYMLGCFQPGHRCIDNAIHAAAGPQLREDCNKIMQKQQEDEMTGGAKITSAYNLPSRFILHTVGPIVPKEAFLSVTHKQELANCYKSCLELANKFNEIHTIAFCAISTGVFGFPKKDAAEIAIETVNNWLDQHPHHFKRVIFNVYTDIDYNEYANVFEK
ncbi:O-acetyl-ADP-ribose deacetylase (regulator of RNase III), contains Macro domain [Gracilibacillus ureilyticus]|uniref:O-acetyl-ADP-ribose deacetylase (Regulator of RNase III), contains Macro domain n=1 Tax=Gracilibacillus ureilyticus TaxID=531814 RepID=A0A1H9T8M1_9BACI|nr:protein-ADP-ribose hydrolase [Gracilibacillus ureilyticus]SER93595.1 O-acetyl-ADP-ribose deacetylase (regulator of RNase III), contains Macro domain [Gracilibacillus ureilyticus]